MYKRIDTDIYVDIAPENIIYLDTKIDLDKFFNLCTKTKMDKTMGMPLQTFSGLSNDNYDSFISNFNSLLLIKDITEDKQVCAFFHLSLAGPARCWYNSLPNDQKDTWAHLQVAFKTKYGADLSPVDIQVLSAEFSNLVWKQGQELEEFYAAITSTGRLLKKSEAEMSVQFVSGLPQQLAFFVRARNPKTLQESLSAAKLGDRYGYVSEKTAPKADPSSSNGDISAMQSAIKDLTVAVQSLQVAQMNSLTVTGHPQQPQQEQNGYHRPKHEQPRYHVEQQSQYNYSPQRMPHAQYQASGMPPYLHQSHPQHTSNQQRHQHSTPLVPSQQRYPTPQMRGNCEKCGCIGHGTLYCNMMDNTRPRPDFTCSRCGQIGHGSARCRTQGN